MGERANSKADQVYDELKEAILSGRLEPGALIDKSALCEQLGVSRFPGLGGGEPARLRAAGRCRAAARLVRGANLGRRRARADVHPPGARKAKSPRRRRARLPRGKGALGRTISRASARRWKRGTGVSFYAHDVGFHQALTTHLGLRREREILDSVRAHLERVGAC